MCVNDILTCGAEPLFFLDYYATGKLKIDNAQAVIEGIAEGCRQAGCALIGGETAEMPGMYSEDEYDLAGFTVGVVDRPALIDGSRIKPGHRVLGLQSSGPHSNGYSLIRNVLEQSGDDPSMPLEGAGEEHSLGEALLAPTRIYVDALLPLIEEFTLDGLAHITGGGISENIIRVVPGELGLEIDLSAWQLPPVFQWLQQNGRIEESEMLRTFNCGIGMVIVVSEGSADKICQALHSAGETVYRIGTVIENKESQWSENNSRVRFIRS
jgi:phosphoribosylformylglycinamidine cyclo-ligase